MAGINKFGNYELHPVKQIEEYSHQAWEGFEDIETELKRVAAEKYAQHKKVVICLDFYPGVDKEDIMALIRTLDPTHIFDMDDYAKEEEKIEREFKDYITSDRVFGMICHKKLEDYFETEQLVQAKKQLKKINKGIVVIAGVGAALLDRGDMYIYCNLTRWEIQLRYRAGMPNWHRTNNQAPILTKYKIGFFIEWRLADRYKKSRYNDFDYMLESEEKGKLKLITGEAFRYALDRLSEEPFRLEPYFDPGVWGGHWMQDNFGLDQGEENYAWSFDGVPEENSLNLKFGNITVKVPAIDLILFRPQKLLGERVHARFGAEFPIRFDLLDTMGGGNLSLQVHPLTEYIQDTFGMHYTQDESYYLLDTDQKENTYVYLGVKTGVDKAAMERDLKLAEKGEIIFPADDYINKVQVKKHDHVLIPAGTIHCSGKNTMVLEISATPYIFTFKLWDWGRVGLDGLPRPIHIEHGLKNIQWNRDTEWIYRNVVGQQQTVDQGEGYKVERTGLHNREFIDTHRYDLEKPYVVEMEDSVHVMNLVEGGTAFIESVDGAFEKFEIHYAETVIVPASVEKYKIVPGDEAIKMIVAGIRK